MVNLRSHTTRLGVLDIGSNTIHMLIVDAAPGARPDPEASTKSTVRLMKYLKDDGSIKKSGIEAILEAVSQCMRLAEEYDGRIAFGAVNVEECPRTVKEFRISSVPTLTLLVDGITEQRLIGLRPIEELRSLLGNYARRNDRGESVSNQDS